MELLALSRCGRYKLRLNRARFVSSNLSHKDKVMGASVVDRRVVENKASSAPVEPRRDRKAAQEHPDLRRSFGAIYKSDRLTLEAAVRAFLKP